MTRAGIEKHGPAVCVPPGSKAPVGLWKVRGRFPYGPNLGSGAFFMCPALGIEQAGAPQCAKNSPAESFLGRGRFPYGSNPGLKSNVKQVRRAES